MKRPPLELVVIGGSAGALDPLLAIVSHLSPELAVPIVVVLHLVPGQPSLVPRVLSARTARPVHEAEDKQPLARDAIYVAPPDYHVLVERARTLALSVDERVHFSRPAIDVLFESAAEAVGPGVAGVVLSGANEDGAAGLARICEAGGHAIVQAPATAAHPTMPEAALRRAARGARAVPPEELAAFLHGIAGGTETRSVDEP